MVEHQENTKTMENLNIIVEINEEGEMANFDIALRNTELPYKNTDEYEYVVEEFEKVKEVNHKKFRCLLARELNCFACTAIYRFQLIFVRRKRKFPVVEYVPAVRNTTYVTSSPVPIVRQQQQQQHSVVKVVSPKVVGVPAVKNNFKTVPVRNTISVQQPSTPQKTHRIVIAQQQPLAQTKKDEDASRLRNMLEKRQLQQQQHDGPPAKKIMVTKQNVGPRRVQPQQQIVQTVQEVGSSEEDIETEIIDPSNIVEVENTSPSTRSLNKSNKVVVQREPNVSGEEDEKLQSTNDGTSELNPLKCDLCNKEFHSLRQRERHRNVCTSNTGSNTNSSRNKSISLDESASPKHQSPRNVTPVTVSGTKRTTTATRRGKLSQTPDPHEDVSIEVTTAVKKMNLSRSAKNK